MKSVKSTPFPFRRSSVGHVWSRVASLLILLGATSDSVTAQHFADTFDITTMTKTPAHPHYGVGHSIGYAVNGVEGATMTLVRDSVYLLRVLDVPGRHQFYIYTAPIGGGEDIYDGDMDDDWNASTGIMRMRPTDDDPDTLYYASSAFPWMGGIIHIIDAPPITSVPLHPALIAGHSVIHPNPLVDHAALTFTLAEPSDVRWDIADAMGRIVFKGEGGRMESGDNRVPIDASSLPAGIYLYRVTAGDEETTRFTGRFQVLR